MNEGNLTHAVFLDFAKAFDSVPHQRLLLKLENLGIRGNVLNWIKGFVSDRQQRVSVPRWRSLKLGICFIRSTPRGNSGTVAIYSICQ